MHRLLVEHDDACESGAVRENGVCHRPCACVMSIKTSAVDGASHGMECKALGILAGKIVGNRVYACVGRSVRASLVRSATRV